MWLLPTRNRPEIVKALIASMREAGEVPDVAVMIDGDPSLYADVDWPAHWHVHVAEEHLEVVGATNRLFALHPGKKFYGLLLDHARALSPGAWSRLEASAGDWNVAFCEDETHRVSPRSGLVKMPVATCLGGELCRALGYVLPDFAVHFWVDDALEELVWELGIVRMCPDAVIRNLLFSEGAIPRDSNHDRIFRGKPFAADDQRAFEEWRKVQKPQILGKLKALIPSERCGLSVLPKDAKAVTICCVNAGNYQGRGAEYVNNLFDMVWRNLSIALTFVCFTDDAEGLNPLIDARPLPVPGLDGWWNKLALFKDGVFPDGARIWFFDLDTVITGDLDEIFEYGGAFATLKDFYYPTQVGPAVMSWRVGELSKSIWNEWESNGLPQDGHGDLWWINNLDQGRFAKRCDKLQDLFPDCFVSFKVHCQPSPPKGASVVCFHGEPRPHQADAQWVRDFWKVGGATMASVQTFCNVPDSELKANIRAACQLEVPWLGESAPHKGEAVLVGGGPSLLDNLGMIRVRQNNGQKVFALNNAAKALAEEGIVPDYHIVMDARAENAAFVRDSRAAIFIIASQASPETWKAVGDRPAVLFHVSIPGLRDMLPAETILVGGGTTVLTRAMAIVHFMGFRYQHLYGVDSSFRGETHHAYEQALNADRPSEVIVNGKAFQSCPWMRAQVDEFQMVATALAEEGAVISVHGDGLLPYVAQLMAA